MTEDVETILAGLEARLRALQSEIDATDDGDVPSTEEAPRAPTPPPPSVSRSSAAGEPDALEEFGRDLRNLAAKYDRVIAQTRGLKPSEGILFRDDVALDARADLDGLCALARALVQIPGIAHTDLRAYAGGHAALDLQLDRTIPLVSELRRTLRRSLAVVEAREGRLSVEVGSVQHDGPGSRAAS